MDLFTILFAIVFVVLPLLQKILQKPEEENEERADDPVEAAPVEVREADSWSGDWGEWPGSPAAEEEVVEALPEEAFSHEVRVPEEVRVASPVVSMESLHVDHSVDYQRSSPRKPSTPPARGRRPKYSAHARTLRDPKGLRRALVLSEILGPPRALNPHER